MLDKNINQYSIIKDNYFIVNSTPFRTSNL